MTTPKHAPRPGLGTRIRERFRDSGQTLNLPPRTDLGREIPDFTDTGVRVVDPWVAGDHGQLGGARRGCSP